MKKSLLVVAGITVLLLFYFLINPEFSPKRKALGEAGATLVKANHHHGLVVEGGMRVLKAQHNLPVINRATRYIATFGAHTTVYREIAKVAAEAEGECERLEAILDLAVMSTMEQMNIVALAKSACRLDSPEDEAAWQEAFDLMMTRVTYPSVEVAEKSQI